MKKFPYECRAYDSVDDIEACHKLYLENLWKK